MSRLTTSMSCAVTIQSAYTHNGDDVPCRTNARRSISIWITGSWRSYIPLLLAVPRATTTHGQKSRLSWRPTDSSIPNIRDTNLSMECPMPTRSRFWKNCKRHSHGSGNAPQAATLTEIGKRHDVLEHLDHINDEMELPDKPEPHVSLQSEMKVMREAARALENNSGRNQRPQVKNNER